jgi:hypothetical protein
MECCEAKREWNAVRQRENGMLCGKERMECCVTKRMECFVAKREWNAVRQRENGMLCGKERIECSAHLFSDHQ